MAKQSFWDRFRQSGDRESGSGQWTEPPSIRTVPFAQLERLQPLLEFGKDRRNPEKYDAALIVGLGSTGSHVIRSLVSRLEQDTAGPQKLLRPIILTELAEEELISLTVPVRQFDLLTRQSSSKQKRSNNTSQRIRTEALFREPVFFTPFYEYLNTAVTELATEEGRGGVVRVFLVASAVEQEIGMLGPILQTLRLMQTIQSRPLVNFTLLLSLAAPVTILEPREMFAAMRELGRFTFSGSWHWLPDLPLPGQRRSSINGALVDYVFLVEEAASPGSRVDLRGLAFEDGLGQALTSTLHLFLHPAGHALWENVSNDLTKTGDMRSETRRPFIHSLGLASLYIPITEIQEYEAARLAYAAMFGEQGTPEGLLPEVNARYSFFRAGQEVQNWLRNRHPFFQWILDVDISRLRRLTPIADSAYESFAIVLPADVAYGMVKLLNDPQQTDHLERARGELVWLKNRLLQLNEALEATKPTPNEARHRLQNLLDDWMQALTDMIEQVEGWKRTLLTGSGNITSQETTQTNEPSLFTDDDIFGGISLGAPFASMSSAHAYNSTTVSDSLRNRLQLARENAESELVAISNNPIRQSLIADDESDLREVDLHYTGTIRPELSRHGEIGDSRFGKVRARLLWWADLPRDRSPELILLCVPHDVTDVITSGLPASELSFRAEDGEELFNTLLAVGRNQVQDIENHLARNRKWMNQRLRNPRFRRFLETADQPFLAYDQTAAGSISPDAARKRRYIIGSKDILADDQKKAAFPNAAASSVNDLQDNSAAGLTAFSLTLNIPVDAVTAIAAAEASYGNREELHIYPQEKIATRYETSFRKRRVQSYLFPAELTMAFTEVQLVSLFCQAVIEGVIVVVSPQRINGTPNQRRYWVLPSLIGRVEINAEDEVYTDDDLHLRLLSCLDDFEGKEWLSLLHAMRYFTLEAFLEPSLRKNTSHPLHPYNHAQTVAALLTLTHEVRRDGQRAVREQREFEISYLKVWKQQAANDLLGRAFIDLLQLELKKPLWTGY